jgi:hypothetical protein
MAVPANAPPLREPVPAAPCCEVCTLPMPPGMQRGPAPDASGALPAPCARRAGARGDEG